MEEQRWCSKTDINIQSSALQSGYTLNTFWCQGSFVCLSQSPHILHTGWLPASFIFSVHLISIWLDNKLSHHVNLFPEKHIWFLTAELDACVLSHLQSLWSNLFPLEEKFLKTMLSVHLRRYHTHLCCVKVKESHFIHIRKKHLRHPKNQVKKSLSGFLLANVS